MGKTNTVLLFLHLAGLLLTVAKAERVLKDHMKFENDAGKQKIGEKISLFAFKATGFFTLRIWQIQHLRAIEFGRTNSEIANVFFIGRRGL